MPHLGEPIDVLPRPTGMQTHHRPRHLLLVTLAAGVLLTAGCGGADSADQAAAPAVERAEAPAEDGDARALQDGAVEDAAGSADQSAASGKAAEPSDPQQRSVIATGTVSLESDDVAAARFEVQKVLDTHGGTVSQEETTTGEDGALATARMVLRIPSEEFADATAALEEVATLTSSTYGEEDVTTQVIDVAARIRAQDKSVRRIEALLAEAEDLRTVMSIEQELSRRQGELDSLKSQQEWLADQTDLATLTVHLERSEEPEEDETERAGFLGGLTNGWDSFVAAASGTAAVLGFLLPWLALGALLAGAGWWVRGRRRPAAVTADAAD
ncbi:DUF4349 domain-containing protein [Nocardioides panacisoli]|uniref:DUF4349 domain-containing protein n=1 Tax=Nocardioides panacisoli TaxID=627624 RepID=UPI001C629F3A|nr:DUF4349 domain-containing protein [Nocardioides panacisoli]QYJ03995.1 DUF4349 domain-containing protein [Nocardioides panacisoli]